ncbi:hypothetical protein A3715_18540 [Oleiphilus sp. HI0009]|nr:hypothetical protein A3715_18540 [Oleiphilus sp. HI0009]
MKSTVKIDVKLGENNETAIIKFNSRSSPIVANVVGTELDTEGNINTIYLRSKIHSDDKKDIVFEGWEPIGAISTILKKVS